jgi:hypothetical protein
MTRLSIRYIKVYYIGLHNVPLVCRNVQTYSSSNRNRKLPNRVLHVSDQRSNPTDVSRRQRLQRCWCVGINHD